MGLTEKIKNHCDNKKVCTIERKFKKTYLTLRKGYIVDYSTEFVLLQEVDDFLIDGYLIFPLKSIAELRFNNKDRYYDKMLRGEKLTEEVGVKYKIDLTSWQTIFQSLKDLGLNVIIKNEDPINDSFDIGPITEVDSTSVSIQYFNSMGFLDKEPTKISWNLITIINFDDRYTNTMSKYLRNRKTKKLF